MKIALDATPLGDPSGGIARYTTELLKALTRNFPEDQFLLLSDRPFETPLRTDNLKRTDCAQTFLERRWWSFGLQRHLRIHQADVFHGVDFAVPFPKVCPAVMTIHDLSPWREDPWVDSHWRTRTARIRRRTPWLLRGGAVAHVITPSAAIRTETIDRFGLSPEKVTAVPLAASDIFLPTDKELASSYFLFAGMWEARKNIEAVIDAWQVVRQTASVDLILVGPQRAEYPVTPSAPGLRMPGEISDTELAELYRGAKGFIYVSHYEGFGLPVLEAMQSGAPVVISQDPALRETAGDAGIVTSNRQELVDAMRALVDNPEFRLNRRARSIRRAAAFSWDKTANRTHEIYRSVA